GESRPQPVVGDPDHRRLQHVGVLQEYALHLARVDLEAPAQDGVILAATDPEETVTVQHGHVGRAHPVSGWHPDFQEAFGPGRESRVRATVDDPELDTGEGATGTSALLGAVLLVVGQRPAGGRAG